MSILPQRISDPFLVDDEDDCEKCIYCCRPDRALCGEQLDPDEPDDDDDDDAAVLCETCRWKEAVHAPCGAPFCRWRQAWRLRRRSR